MGTNMHLEVRVIYPLDKTTVIVPSQGLYSLKPSLQYHTGISSCIVCLRLNQEVIVIPIMSMLQLHQGVYLSSWQVDIVTSRVHHGVILLKTFSLSGLHGSFQHGKSKPSEKFSGQCQLISLCPAIKVYCVYSNRVLSPSYGGPSKEIVITCVVCEASRTSPKVTHREVSNVWH